MDEDPLNQLGWVVYLLAGQINDPLQKHVDNINDGWDDIEKHFKKNHNTDVDFEEFKKEDFL